MSRLLVGVGNTFRRDDGVGPAVAAEVARRGAAGIEVRTSTGEPGELLDAWTATSVTVVVDAAVGDGASPGRIRRWCGAPDDGPGPVSSHALGLAQTYALGRALGQVPERLVVLTVDVADVGMGTGLTPAVAAAVPAAADLALAELRG